MPDTTARRDPGLTQAVGERAVPGSVTRHVNGWLEQTPPWL
jgi:hypothetical protein